MSIEPVTYIYKIVGTCEIHADVYRVACTPEPSPTIVYIHGGCLIYGSRKDINSKQLELYLQSGYTVIAIDYRLAPETKLPSIIEDLQDTFRWVRENGPDSFGVDPDRVAVVGHSAGGYLALMAGFAVEPRPRALVSFYGYGDIIGDWYSKPDPFYRSMPIVSEKDSGILVKGPIISEPYKGREKDLFYLYCRQRGLWPKEVAGHDPVTESSFFKPYCPIQNISGDYPPTLLLHGTEDTDVPYQQSQMMAKELTRVAVENELISIPDGCHVFDRDMDAHQVKDVFRTVLAFLKKHIR